MPRISPRRSVNADVREFTGAAEIVRRAAVLAGCRATCGKQLRRRAGPTMRRMSSSRSVSRAIARARPRRRRETPRSDPRSRRPRRIAWLMNSSAQPGVAQLARDAEQLGAFALRQRGGGLIEDQHARLIDQRARDLHHVLLRDAQRCRPACPAVKSASRSCSTAVRARPAVARQSTEAAARAAAHSRTGFRRR